MISRDKGLVGVDLNDPDRGRVNPERLHRPRPKDTEPRPVVTPDDIAATRIEIAKWKQRTARKAV
jgi:hypothetical protein